MDKYEYNLKLDQIKALSAEEGYMLSLIHISKEGKELTDGIHRMWQSITGNKGK